VIVRAAKRSSGHLYIKTPDCRVAVTGTVFSVDSGIKGSRVAVIEGTVHVLHAGMDTIMHAGDQVTTSENLSPVPVEQQIAWSHDRDQYLVLLAQFSTLQHRLEQIPLPDAKYTSDLLPRVPADTLLYVSVPNLGEFVSQANSIFHDQLEKSPALQQWWSRGHNPSTAELDTLVEKLHGMSQYLGDEIVLVGLNNSTRPEVAVVADLKQGGLAEFLKTEIGIGPDAWDCRAGTAGSGVELNCGRADEGTFGPGAGTRSGLFGQPGDSAADQCAVGLRRQRICGQRIWAADRSRLRTRLGLYPGSRPSRDDEQGRHDTPPREDGSARQ
jgi:hypothetical protein